MMSSVNTKNCSPMMKIPSIRVTSYQPRYAIPVPMYLQNSDTKKEKIATPKPVKYAIPVRTCFMDLPDSSKPKTPTPKPKYAIPVQFLGCALSTPEDRPRKTARKQLMYSHKKKLGGTMKPPRPQHPIKNVKKLDAMRQLLDLENFENNPNSLKPLNTSLKYTKPKTRFTLASKVSDKTEVRVTLAPKVPTSKTPSKIKGRSTLIPKINTVSKIPEKSKAQFTPKSTPKSNKSATKQNSIEDDTAICRKLDELKLIIDKRFAEFDKRLEQLEKNLKCSCTTKLNQTTAENVITTPKINELINSAILNIDEKNINKSKITKNKFELLEQRLNRGSPLSEFSLSDTESPVVKNTISDLIFDKTDLKKSRSMSNLVFSNKKIEKTDVRSAYEQIRSEASFLCTPKHVTRVCNLMTPSVRLSKNKLVSRTVQKQLLMLDDNN